jgi:predicted Ser/Thr protein kinase
VVSQIEAHAQGDRAGLYPVLLVGVPGSGKSELLEAFRQAASHHTLKTPDNFVYSYEWRGLSDVPALREYVYEGEGVETRTPCPMHDSPFVLMPEPVQDAILKVAGPAASKMIGGLKPAPKRHMCPKCAFFRQELIRHYSQQRGHILTPSEVADILDKHIVLRRTVMGDPGTMPLLPAQAKDVDWSGLFVSKNPAVFLKDPSHPLAYNYNGAILGGNGSAVMLDEVGKNSVDLLAKFLNMFQSRKVQEGGAPLIELDTVFFTATNTKDLVDLRAKDPQSPFVDRLDRSQMNWSIFPEEVVKTAAYEFEGLTATKLGDPNATPVRGRDALEDLIPQRETGKPAVTTDRRYNLNIELGDTNVHMAPQALMFVARVAALSRMSFDGKAAEKWGIDPDLVAQPPFRNMAARLKALEGTYTMTPSQAMELMKLSELSGEGTFGMSARDVTKWLKLAVQESKKAHNGNCVTPGLLRETLDWMVRNEKIGVTAEERVNFLKLARLVALEFTKPAMISDINEAVSGSQDGTIHQIYDELIAEMMQLHRDPGSKTYIPNGTNTPMPIRRDRLAAIEMIYQKNTGRPLSISEIAMFTQGQVLSGNSRGVERHRDLLSAITTWQAAKTAEAHDANLRKLIAIAAGRANGSADELDLVHKLTDAMEHEFGYCKHCAMKALEMIQEAPDGASPGPKQPQ